MKLKKSLFLALLTSALALSAYAANEQKSDEYLLDYDYYDTYSPGYDEDYSDDWYYDYYDQGDTFSEEEYDLDYDWVEGEYEWEEDDLMFDDNLEE